MISLKRGVNLSHWLSQSERRGAERDAWMCARDFESIASFGFDHVTIAGNDQGSVFVGDREHGFEAAEGAVSAPFFGELDSGANQVALVFLKLAFETLEEREGVSGGPGKTGDDLAVVQATNFLRVAFHHGIAERNLAVAAHDDFAVAAN